MWIQCNQIMKKNQIGFNWIEFDSIKKNQWEHNLSLKEKCFVFNSIYSIQKFEFNSMKFEISKRRFSFCDLS
jgi:hypothetical protein